METKVPEQNKEQEHARWRVWSRGETAALPRRLAPNYFYIMTGSQEEDVQAILKPPFLHAASSWSMITEQALLSLSSSQPASDSYLSRIALCCSYLCQFIFSSVISDSMDNDITS